MTDPFGIIKLWGIITLDGLLAQFMYKLDVHVVQIDFFSSPFQGMLENIRMEKSFDAAADWRTHAIRLSCRLV